jgi:hypothetical protein
MNHILLLSNRQLSRYSDLLLAGQSDVRFSTRSRGSSLSKTSVSSLGPTQPVFFSGDFVTSFPERKKWPWPTVDLVPRLRMEGAVPLLPLHVKMECANCGARELKLWNFVSYSLHLDYKGVAATELYPLIVHTSSWNLLTRDYEGKENTGTSVSHRSVHDCLYTGLGSWALSNETHGTTSSDVPSLFSTRLLYCNTFRYPHHATSSPFLFVFVFQSVTVSLCGNLHLLRYVIWGQDRHV